MATSMPQEPVPSPEHRPWWKERMLWLVIGLPIAAVAASFATLMIASHDPDDLVEASYVKTGLAVQAPDQLALQEAASLGLQMEVRHQGEQLILTPLAGDIQDQQLRLRLIHPTQADLDVDIVVYRTNQGYAAPLPKQEGVTGKRQVVLTDEASRWRLQGEWSAPFDQPLLLSAFNQNP